MHSAVFLFNLRTSHEDDNGKRISGLAEKEGKMFVCFHWFELKGRARDPFHVILFIEEVVTFP